MNRNQEEWLSDVIDGMGDAGRLEEIAADRELQAMVRTIKEIQAARVYEAPSPDFAMRGWEQIVKETQWRRTSSRRIPRKRLGWMAAAVSCLLIAAIIMTQFLGSFSVNASEIRVIAETQLADLGVKQALTPQYAGSDETISYTTDDQIQLWNRATGQSVKLPLANFLYSRDAAWSADGKKLAFTGFDKASSGPSTPGLWTARSDGAELRLILSPADTNTAFEGPVWSPDGNRIAFTAVKARLSDETGVTYERTVALVNADGSGYEAVAAGSQPAWSPDGQTLAYTIGGGAESPQIWTINLSDRTKRQLTNGQMPAWSPAGSFIAFVKTRTENRTLDNGTAIIHYQELWAVRIDNSAETQLTRSANPERLLNSMLKHAAGSAGAAPASYVLSGETSDWQPAWSADGKHLLFTQDMNEESAVHFALKELTLTYN